MNVDVGGGSADLATFRIQRPSMNKYKSHLELVGKPQSILCGSQFINQEFVNILERRRDVEKIAQRLKISDQLVRTRLFEAFERWKPGMDVSALEDPSRGRVHIGVIHGNSDADKDTTPIPSLASGEITDIFDESIDKIVDRVGKQLKKVREDVEKFIQVSSSCHVHCICPYG